MDFCVDLGEQFGVVIEEADSDSHEELYHLTEEKNITSILENGLIAQIGVNSAFAHENENAVYLTERKYLLVWAALLEHFQLFKVSANQAERYDWNHYSEYRVVEDNISEDNIEYLGEYVPTQEDIINAQDILWASLDAALFEFYSDVANRDRQQILIHKYCKYLTKNSNTEEISLPMFEQKTFNKIYKIVKDEKRTGLLKDLDYIKSVL